MSITLSNAAEYQPEVVSRLRQATAAGKLPTSLLFTGKKGVGKWLTAFTLAKSLTCGENGPEPCGRCASCRQAESFSHPDILHLFPLPADEKKWPELFFPYLQQKSADPFGPGSDDVTSFITIDAIRRFHTTLSRKASLSSCKVGIINEAERMLPGTMDALLKLLEEPPPQTFLIVVTDQPRFLHQTIISRLRRVRFPEIAPETIANYLQQQLEIDRPRSQTLSRQAAGSLYQIGELLEGDVLRLRDLAWKAFTEALKLTQVQLRIKYSDRAAFGNRDQVQRLLSHWQGFLRDLALLGSVAEGSSADAQLINPDLSQSYPAVVSQLRDTKRIDRCNEKLEQVRAEIRRNIDPRMAAFSFLSFLASPQRTVV
jgi:DNA polymerase-3 subunit delta'